MQKYGITAEQAGDGSPDLRWLRDGGGEAHWYAAGDHLPFGCRSVTASRGSSRTTRR